MSNAAICDPKTGLEKFKARGPDASLALLSKGFENTCDKEGQRRDTDDGGASGRIKHIGCAQANYG